MTTDTATPRSARDRLLDSATELFYAEGVHTVGIDRVIEHAGVAKATLYSAFGSKDALVRAYLEGRHQATRTRIETGLPAYATAREKLVGVFEIQAQRFGDPTYRGCAFVGASVESRPHGAAADVSADYRGWVRGLFTELAREAGASDPERLAHQLAVVWDGAAVAAWMDHDPATADASCTIARTLVDAALG